MHGLSVLTGGSDLQTNQIVRLSSMSSVAAPHYAPRKLVYQCSVPKTVICLKTGKTQTGTVRMIVYIRCKK